MPTKRILSGEVVPALQRWNSLSCPTCISTRERERERERDREVRSLNVSGHSFDGVYYSWCSRPYRATRDKFYIRRRLGDDSKNHRQFPPVGLEVKVHRPRGRHSPFVSQRFCSSRERKREFSRRVVRRYFSR